MKDLIVKNKKVKLPIYLPDATKAITKSLDSNDLTNCGIRGVVVNTYHLMNEPGIEVLNKHEGVSGFMNFNGLVVSDSGGWQVFSLIKRHNLPGKITDEGVTFSQGNAKKQIFTPEKSIQVQFKINSDIIICLDDFVPHTATKLQNQVAVKRTIEWAKRCKAEYTRILDANSIKKEDAPLLFSVIQGGYDKELRKKCADALCEIGFDGYGFGGYVIDEITNSMDLDIAEYIAGLIPNTSYKFALGVGKPNDIVACQKMGWEIFDCTLPTRDARHKRLFVSSNNKQGYEFLYINKGIYKSDATSLDENCDCLTCSNYSKAYLHHLFKIGDTSAFRLATIHNLRFYTRLIDSIM